MQESDFAHEGQSQDMSAVLKGVSRQSASVETRKHHGTSAEGMPSAALGTSSPVAGENPKDLAYIIREEGTVSGDGVEEEQLEDEADTAAIDDPFDPTTIRITTKQPTVDLVVDRMRHEEIDLQPDFQRGDNVWPIRTRSRLIESLLLRIPLPVFYMAADRNDNWKVVDGLQRLSTLRDFVLNKKLRLRGLEYLTQFDGNSFDDLPRPMQRRITETQLSCHVIEPGTPPEVMYNVFKRINTEGRPLVAQEIRHALNPGPGP